MKSSKLLEKITIDWSGIAEGSYLRNIEAIRELDQLVFSKPITFFVGENGSGKSTLLEAIAVAYGFNPEGGTKNYVFSTYDSHSELCDHIGLVRGPRRAKWGYFLRAECFYNVATKEEEYSRGPGSNAMSERYHSMSHGESFLSVIRNNLQKDSIYLLDEPEAALSPQRQLTLLMLIHECTKLGSQFIIVSHSPILLGTPGAEILSFDNGKIHPVSYEETESYQVISMFINHREQMLYQLLR